jgi:hypothetical protein
METGEGLTSGFARKRIAEAVQRPTMKFVATKTADQLDLQACTGCASGLSVSARASSFRSAPSCTETPWDEALQASIAR